ncbi:hypothetical protein BKA62DRAFT_634277 [Auriculariales sp. MPI-PUGE-AT-0066]|nr:hypothetical protein BKA62DRAFT_634277 [Auriculariales sp. MPI-PUGE-AT-0066]
MSSSPVIVRLSSRSSTGSKHEEELINAYEAEEERIINVLSRKLEQLKDEKIQLENALEAESESHVNRLTRELAVLRAQQIQQLQHQQQLAAGDDLPLIHPFLANVTPAAADPRHPTTDTVLDALRRENDALRTRIVGMERDYVRVVRQCDMYREELIDHRRRLGIEVDSLASQSISPVSQPIHRRSSSSPTASMVPLPIPGTSRQPMPMAIPRSNSQVHVPRAPVQARPASPRTPSANTTPLSSGATSPFSLNGHTGMTVSSSLATDLTTPPSSASLNANMAATLMGTNPLSMLTYPSVPPPSLSSSLGSPVQQFPPRWTHTAPSRHSSVERGGRVAETGSLSRRGSVGQRPSQIARAGGTSTAVVESVPESPVEAILLA